MLVFMLVSQVLLWLVVFALAFLLLGALRSLGLLRWQITQLRATTPSRLNRNGLRPGTMAPDFALPSTAGPEVRLSDFAGRRTLLVFTQAGCGPCRAVLPELDRLQQTGEVQVLVVNHAEVDAELGADGSSHRFPVLVQRTLDVSKRYQAFVTPFGFLIDEAGVIRASGLISDRQHLHFVLSGEDGGARATPAEAMTERVGAVES
jgi:methylamine dehydrogenase accessory protein MauD